MTGGGGGNRSQPQVVKTRVKFYVCLVCFTINKSEQNMKNVTIFLLVSSDLFHYEQIMDANVFLH